VRFSGSTLIAFAHRDSNDDKYYRKGTLENDGTITWNAEVNLGIIDEPNQGVAAAIINNKPVLWRVGKPANTNRSNPGRFTFGDQLDSPVIWNDSVLAPALTTGLPNNGTSRGGTPGIIFQIGSDPEDLIVLRATARDGSYIADGHRLVAIKYDAGGAGFDSQWYSVSTLGGTLTEDNSTQVRRGSDTDVNRRFAAVKDTNGNIHAVYVSRNEDVAHYRKAAGFSGAWSRVSADVTGSADNIDKVALTAADNGNLYLFYVTLNVVDMLYYRLYDGTSWGPETLLYDGSTIGISSALGSMESSVGCGVGVAWEDETAAPFDVRFSLGPNPCGELQTTQGASTITVTAPGSFEMVFDQDKGGGVGEFYDLAETATKGKDGVTDLAGATCGTCGQHTLFSDEVQVAGNPTYKTPNSSAADGVTMELLEATATRVRVRSQTPYKNQLSALLAGITGTGDYSVYPSGRMAIGWNRNATALIASVNQAQLQMTVHYQSAGVLSNWHAYSEGSGGGGRGDLEDGIPFELPQDDFGLWQIEQTGARTDFLMIWYQDWIAPLTSADSISFLKNGTGEYGEIFWQDNVTDTHPGGLPAGYSETWNYLFYFKPTTFVDYTHVEVTRRRDDYRGPDTLTVTTGTGWFDSNENTSSPSDFFNESEAAYTLDLNPGSGLNFAIDGTVANPRYEPFLKIRQWRSNQDPVSVTLGLTTLTNDVDYKADVKPIARAYFCTTEFAGCTSLANGGLVGSADEYLADPAAGKNYDLAFSDGDDYVYLGADAKFRGINVSLATVGTGTADLAWQYWNGAIWANLEAVTGFTDQTSNLTTHGTIYWGDDAAETDPAGWTTTSVNSSPALYFVRARVASGSYTQTPIEALIKTDILLLQYCGEIQSTETIDVSPPTPPTAVDLVSFEAIALDGAVELTWETGSEIDNLGFHLYRSS
jgi:hypothetical protein